MPCPTCHAEVPADAAFCPKCGQRVGAASAGVPAPTAAAATPAEKLRAGQGVGPAPHEPEHELWRGRYSPKAMYGGWVLALVLTVAAIVLAVLVPVGWIAAVIAV